MTHEDKPNGGNGDIRSLAISPRERLMRIEETLVRIEEKLDERTESLENRIHSLEVRFAWTLGGIAATAAIIGILANMWPFH